MLRGISSFGDQKPLYVIDGILYDNIPANITPDMIADVMVLKPAEAVGIYGEKAADGAVVIATKSKNARSQFRDYAFWKPEFFTDENGDASFIAEYPDNITGWQTYVLGMDKKRRMGKAITYVRSFKPLSATLSMPQFLISGDSVQLVGKLFNYTHDSYSVVSSFSAYQHQYPSVEATLESNASKIEKVIVAAGPQDSLTATFTLRTSTGFRDAEERKIPVLKKGVEEATGNFWVLDKDTTVIFRPDSRSENIEVYAQQNTLDILLNEIEHLKEYPYYCNEQIASKLIGMLMKKKINESLRVPFTEEKTIQFLLKKLQKAQLYDGGWSWWENGKANVYITAYVINALLPLRSDPLVETNIRNGLLYLQGRLTYLNEDELLAVLVTMSNAKHLIDYTSWIEKLKFDSLTQHEQWLWIRLNQQQGFEYRSELQKLLSKAVPGMLGSLHWGEDNYTWQRDAIAATVLAFDVLEREKNFDDKLNAILKYFLEQRKRGYWTNTVESASIISTVLPYTLSKNINFSQPCVLHVAGDTSFTITAFPFRRTLQLSAVNSLTVSKSGGGLTYLTIYQRYLNTDPEPFDEFFKVKTSFENNGQVISSLVAGQAARMTIEINAVSDADYVMIEVPIPAGCTYKEKPQADWNIYREYLRNAVVLFAERIAKGSHTYSIELEPRYSGVFTINPAKVSLMYFPTFFGRNEVKRISIGE